MKYTTQQLDEAALHDLRIDAETSEHQSVNGPFYPERGITSESLRAYAKTCRETIARCASGGAHSAVMNMNNDKDEGGLNR